MKRKKMKPAELMIRAFEYAIAACDPDEFRSEGIKAGVIFEREQFKAKLAKLKAAEAVKIINVKGA